jgi:hypothetical protein
LRSVSKYVTLTRAGWESMAHGCRLRHINVGLGSAREAKADLRELLESVHCYYEGTNSSQDEALAPN